MLYILQKEKGEYLDEDVFCIYKLLASNFYNYKYYDWNFINNEIPIFDINTIKNIVPIGDLRFIRAWLNYYYNVQTMAPIEVPKVLRTEEFLQRDYIYISKEKVPDKGSYFLKYVDKLKQFSYIGDLTDIDREKLPNGHYILSNVIQIVSEYRVFVDELKIKAIQHYDGECTVFPNVNTIKKMINMYYLDRDNPSFYCMDVGVTKEGKTIIIEVHPITSVGLYGYCSLDLLTGYKKGIEWYINHKEFNTFS